MLHVLPFLNSPKYLAPSCKTDLGFWDCFGRKICLITKEIWCHVLESVSCFIYDQQFEESRKTKGANSFP